MDNSFAFKGIPGGSSRKREEEIPNGKSKPEGVLTELADEQVHPQQGISSLDEDGDHFIVTSNERRQIEPVIEKEVKDRGGIIGDLVDAIGRKVSENPGMTLKPGFKNRLLDAYYRYGSVLASVGIAGMGLKKIVDMTQGIHSVDDDFYFNPSMISTLESTSFLLGGILHQLGIKKLSENAYDDKQ